MLSPNSALFGKIFVLLLFAADSFAKGPAFQYGCYPAGTVTVTDPTTVYATDTRYSESPETTGVEAWCQNSDETTCFSLGSTDGHSQTTQSQLSSAKASSIPDLVKSSDPSYPPYVTSTSSTLLPSPSTTNIPGSFPCIPSVDLVGVKENGFNAYHAPFSINITECSTFDVNQTTVLANFQAIPDLVITPDAVNFTGFTDDYVLLSLFALDTNGYPIIKSWELHFGSVNMPILILNPDDTPAEGVHVEANATVYPGLTGSCTTNANGICTIENLPGTTISLVARTDNNSIAINGLAPTAVQVTMKLLPFLDPKPDASFDIDNGTTGWTGGTLHQSLKVRRDTTLVVNTNAQYTLQTATNSFSHKKGYKKAFIKYRFITAEVPGGYFGTEFNDYFTVTIRTDTGAFVTVTNSMNALGLGAFDASGATNVFTLTLDVPAKTKAIMFDVGVSNVADNLLDSSLVIEQVGENKCDKCDTCTECPDRPACQDNCINPPPYSCAFYADCAEGELQCGASGYPIRYGQKNCLAFSKNLNFFTLAGQSFVWDTMSCLQRFLSPIIRDCKETCEDVSVKAFASHPGCYTDSGFCGLGCGDIIVLLAAVNKDMLEVPRQIWDTAKICLTEKVETLTGCAGEVFVGTAAAAIWGVGLAGQALIVAGTVAGRYLAGLTAGTVVEFF